MTTPGSNDINTEVSLADELSVPARTAAQSAEELAKEIRTLNRQLLMLDKRATKAALSVAQLDAAMSAYTGRTGGATQMVGKLDNATEKYSKTLVRNTMRLNRSTRAVKSADRAGNRFAGTMKRLFKILDTGGKGLKPRTLLYIALGTAISGAIAPAFQLGAALSSIAGLLVIIPSLVGAFGLTLLTLMVGFKGVGEAIGTAISGDWEEFNEALKNLSPEARKFAKEIRRWRGTFKEIKKSVQDALFRPISKEITKLLRAQVPVFKRGMTDLAVTFGLVFGNIMRFFSGPEGIGMIRELFRNAKVWAVDFSRAVRPVLSGLSALIIGLGPSFDKMSERVGNIGIQFGDWLKKIGESGQAAKWFDTAMIMGGQLLEIFQSIGRILLDISKAAGGMSFTPLQIVLDVIERFTSSAEGQAALIAFFSAMRTVIGALTPLLGTLGSIIGTVIAPILADIVSTLAPHVDTLFKAIGQALADTAPMWPVLADALGKLLIALVPLLPPLAQLLNAVGGALANALIVLAGILTTLFTAIGPPLAEFFKTLAKIFEEERPLIEELIGAFVEGFKELGPVLLEITKIFTEEFLKFLKDDLLPMVKENIPFLKELAKTFGKFMVGSLKQLLPLLPGLARSLMDIFRELTKPEVQEGLLMFLKALVDLTPAMIELIPHFTKITELAVILVAMLAIATVKIIAWIGDVATRFGKFVGDLIRTFARIKDAIVEPFRNAYNEAYPIINKLIQAFNNIPGLLNLPMLGPLGPGPSRDLGERGGAKGGTEFFNRYMGGPVGPGANYMVGEAGREMYVPGQGSAKMIGDGGPEMMQFPTSGTIIPNYMLKAMERAGAGMENQLAKMGEGSSAAELRELAKVAAGEGGAHNYDIDLNFPPGMTMPAPHDIEKAVLRAMKKIEADRKERS